MSLNCGIVGLPNVGKSTLFNALTATMKAESANYPFCTIEPNKGIVDLIDERLDILAKINSSKVIYPAKLEFLDIAGLVKGAHKGEGLGNKFLANIRESSAIIHVLRCFDDTNVIHVADSVDPARDAEIVNTELMIADMESLEKSLANFTKKNKSLDKNGEKTLELGNLALETLKKGSPLRSLNLSLEDQKYLKVFNLLTLKPMLYVCNVDENNINNANNPYVKMVKDLALKENLIEPVIICSKIEQELSSIEDKEEKQEYLKVLGLAETGLNKIVKAAFNLLDLQTYFTVGPKEAHAWTISKTSTAKEAAGVIHSDFERGFISAEVISYADYIATGSEVKAKEQGKMHQEGKEYIVSDGDIITFRFNV